MRLLWRVLKIIVGVFVAFANLQGPAGTVLGFYALNSPQMIGFDVAKVAIDVACAWLIYRGFRPAVKRPIATPKK
jgi:hypothetical protein